MNKSIEELPIPEIKTKLYSEKSKNKEKKIMYMDDLLSKIFLRTYFKKKK